MQRRRRREMTPPRTPAGEMLKVPGQHWDDLEKRDLEKLCGNALARSNPPSGLILPFLKEDLLVDIKDRCLRRQSLASWVKVDHPLLELVCLVYLLGVGAEPLRREMVGVKDLKDAHFFAGPHELKVMPVLDRYGNDPDGFKRAAEGLEGRVLDLADSSYEFLVFPKIPVYYLLWRGDKEFGPNLSVLFDRSIEHHLASDAIWGVVNLVSDSLLRGGKAF